MDRDLRAQLLAILTITRGMLRDSATHDLCSEISEFDRFGRDGTLFAISTEQFTPIRELVRCFA
jgi:hypothetical protein